MVPNELVCKWYVHVYLLYAQTTELGNRRMYDHISNSSSTDISDRGWNDNTEEWNNQKAQKRVCRL